MDTISIGPCKVPEVIRDIASKPGRLTKDKDGEWRAPSNTATGGRVTTVSMVAWGGAVVPWGSDALHVPCQ